MMLLASSNIASAGVPVLATVLIWLSLDVNSGQSPHQTDMETPQRYWSGLYWDGLDPEQLGQSGSTLSPSTPRSRARGSLLSGGSPLAHQPLALLPLLRSVVCVLLRRRREPERRRWRR
jgi:hypothetical protein